MIQRRKAEQPNGIPSRSADDKNPYLKHGKKIPFAKFIPLLSLCGVIVLLVLVSGRSSSPSPSSSSETGTKIHTETTGKIFEPFPPEEQVLSPGVEYHIVFSTGCSIYQDWQSYVFFYQAMVIRQPGTVTRIVSGCSDEEEKTLQAVFDEQIRPMAPSRFKIHFTPDFSSVKGSKQKFVYFNKPFGMRHWLENAIGFPRNPQNEDAIVILLDPDQLITRPFTGNNFTNTEWKFVPTGEEPRTQITHGYPMGQLYGFGLQWADKVDMKGVLKEGETTPISDMSRDELRRGYIVGPPYVATGECIPAAVSITCADPFVLTLWCFSARDMYKIVSKWSEFAPPVHEQYPYLLAEMFAYCLAAAHLKLSHQTAISFMISDTGAGGFSEGWHYIERIADHDICSPRSIEDVPNVIHYCQRYGIDKFFFGKRRLPKDFLTCEAPLLREPKLEELSSTKVKWPTGQSKEWKPEVAKRHRFMLCVLIPSLNDAATFFKKHHCDPSTANYDKTFTFFDDR